MNTFTTRSTGRIHVHILPHARFRTRDFILRLHTPLKRRRVTATALLPHMWMNGTKSLPSTRALTIAADELYGTIVRTSLGKRGDYHILEVAASLPDVSGWTEADIAGEAIRLAVRVLTDHELQVGAFADGKVQQEMALHRRRIEAARDDKMSYALSRCLALVAEDAPAALPRLGFSEDLPQLTPAELWQTYETVLQSAEAHIYLVGPFADADQLADQLTQQLLPMFGENRDQPPLRMTALPPQSTRSTANPVREAQDVMQGQLDLGYRTGVNFAHKAYPAMLMMNGILGGFAHSKLFRNVREKHSLAYNVWSHFDAMTGALAIMTGIDPSKYDEAMSVIADQVAAMQAGDISEDEIEFTFRGLQNQYTVFLDQPSALANWHYNGILTGAARDIEELIQTLGRIDKDEIVAAAAMLNPHTIYFLSGEDAVS